MDPQELLSLFGYGGEGDTTPDTASYANLLYPQEQAQTPAPQMQLQDPFAGQAPPQAPSPLPSNVQSVGVSQGDRGFDPAKLAQIEAGPMGSGVMSNKKQTAGDKIRGQYQPYLEGLQQVGNAESANMAQQGDLQAQAAVLKAKYAGEVASETTRHQSEMMKLNESAVLAKQTAKDEYRQKLLEIPQLNPNALWDEAGAAGQFQMGVAAFVHNMLAVKGIKTSAMDTINQAIQNKIDAQIQNIKTKKDVAAGFKDIYEMVVADSASEVEAKDRLHGYFLKSMEAGITAEMGKIDAPMAKLKGQAAVMEIRKAQLDNMMKVEKHIDDATDKAYGREITIRGQNLSASIASKDREARLKIAEMENEARKQPKAPAPDVYVYDPETGKGKFKFKPGIEDKTKMAKLEEAGKFEAANETMTKIRELERKMKPQIDGISKTRLAPEDARRYEALVNALAHELVAARGERPTDKDVIQELKRLPMDTMATNGDVSRVLADTQLSLSTSFNSQMRQFVDDVPEGMQPEGRKGIMAEGSRVDAEATIAGGQTPETKRFAPFIEKARGAGALDVKPDEDDPEFKEYTIPLWKAYSKDNPDTLTKAPGAKKYFKDFPTEGFDAVREIASHANAGDEEALNELQRLASDGVRPGNQQDLVVQSYASWFIDKMQAAPEQYQAGGHTYEKPRPTFGN